MATRLPSIVSCAIPYQDGLLRILLPPSNRFSCADIYVARGTVKLVTAMVDCLAMWHLSLFLQLLLSTA